MTWAIQCAKIWHWTKSCIPWNRDSKDKLRNRIHFNSFPDETAVSPMKLLDWFQVNTQQSFLWKQICFCETFSWIIYLINVVKSFWKHRVPLFSPPGVVAIAAGLGTFQWPCVTTWVWWAEPCLSRSSDSEYTYHIYTSFLGKFLKNSELQIILMSLVKVSVIKISVIIWVPNHASGRKHFESISESVSLLCLESSRKCGCDLMRCESDLKVQW